MSLKRLDSQRLVIFDGWTPSFVCKGEEFNLGDLFKYKSDDYEWYGKIFKIKDIGQDQVKVFYEKVINDKDGVFHTCDAAMLNLLKDNITKIDKLPFDFDWS